MQVPIDATLWFDGACSGNPGPMGAGAVVEADGQRLSHSAFRGMGTNNQAEYQGLILGLKEALKVGATKVSIRGDSELVVRQVRGEYRVRKPELKPLHAQVLSLMANFQQATIEWIPREQNTEADAAARKGLDQKGS